jgi:hypothetical protein
MEVNLACCLESELYITGTPVNAKVLGQLDYRRRKGHCENEIIQIFMPEYFIYCVSCQLPVASCQLPVSFILFARKVTSIT